MKRTVRWAAGALAAVMAMAGGWLSPPALADSGKEEFTSVDVNLAIVGFINHAQEYKVDNDWACAEMWDISEHCDENVLDFVARLALDTDGDLKMAEALARSLGLPSTGVRLSDEDEKYIAALAGLDAHELKVLCGLKDYIRREHEAWKVGETIAPTPEPTCVPEEKREPLLKPAEYRDGIRMIIAGADTIGCLMEAYFRSGNQEVQNQVAGYFDTLSTDEQIEVLAYLQKRMGRENYADFTAWLTVGYLASGLEAADFSALTREGDIIGDPSGAAQDTAPGATPDAVAATPAPTGLPAASPAPEDPAADAAGDTPDAVEPQPEATPEPLTAEEAKDLGDFLMSKLGQDDRQQEQDLADWFLGLSIADQNAIMDSLRDSLDRDDYDEFFAWLIAAEEAMCPGKMTPSPDALSLFGKDWNALTLPGLPAPAQGTLHMTTAVKNRREGRQAVLSGVREETFEAWLAQIAQDSGFVGDADADGSPFSKNFGPSFADDLQDSGGQSATRYYLQPGEDGNAEVRVDYLYTDQMFSVAVLDP